LVSIVQGQLQWMAQESGMHLSLYEVANILAEPTS